MLSFLLLIRCGCSWFFVVAFWCLRYVLEHLSKVAFFFQGTKEVDNLLVLVLFQSMQRFFPLTRGLAYTDVSY